MRSVGGPVQGCQDDKGRKDLWPCFRIPRFKTQYICDRLNELLVRLHVSVNERT